MAVTLVSNFFAFPFHQMVPVIGREVLAADALRFGILVAAWGTGALAGSITLAARAVRRPAWVFFAGMSSLFVCIAGFALSGAYLLSVGLLLAGGIGFSGFASMQILITLRSAPQAARGRSLGVVGLAIGVNPLGNVILGLVAERVGPQAALAGFALLGLSGLALVRWRYPELGRRAAVSDPPPEPPPEPAGAWAPGELKRSTNAVCTAGGTYLSSTVSQPLSPISPFTTLELTSAISRGGIRNTVTTPASRSLLMYFIDRSYW